MVDVYGKTPPGKIAGREILKSLGTGVMGQNFLAKDGRFTFVIKAINHVIAERRSEAGKLKGDTRHPNILAVKEAVVDEIYDEVYITDYINDMECPGRAFFWKAGIKETLVTFRKIADAFRFAHETGVTHNNFKPSNLLVKKRKKGIFPMVTDFGFRLKFDGVSFDAAKKRNVLPYMAPELIRDFKAGKEYNVESYKKCDLYSFGAMFCEAISARDLFGRCVDFDIALEEKADLAARVIGVTMPNKIVAIPPLDRLIKGCLAFSSEKRMDSFKTVVGLLTESLGDQGLESDDTEER
ncbi:MAG: protein kinase [Planctomycetota bacterium]